MSKTNGYCHTHVGVVFSLCVTSAVYCFGTRKWQVLMDTRSEVLTERKNT